MSSARSLMTDSLRERSRAWFLVRFQRRRAEELVRSWSLAWPTFAWRVYAPVPAEHDFDPLQRAVLRLAAAGRTDAVTVARLLSVRPDLIASVQQYLRHAKHLDRCLEITEAGRKHIEGNEGEEPEADGMQTGWLFRDAISGDVLPFFYSDSLPGAPAAAAREAILLPFDPILEAPPSPPAIRHALRLYRRIRAYDGEHEAAPRFLSDRFDPEMLEETAWEDVPDEPQEFPRSADVPPRLARVLTRQPERVDLEAHLYVTCDAPNEWQISAPYGVAGGYWYRRKLEWALERSPSLREQLDRLLGEAKQSFAPPARPAPNGGPLATDEEQPCREFPILAADARLHDVAHHLAQAYDSERILEERPSARDLVLTRYNILAEALLDACVQSLEPALRHKVVRHIAESGIQCHRDHLAAVEAALSIQLPFPLKKLAPARIASAGRGQAQSVRDRLMFLCFFAFYHPDSSAARTITGNTNVLEDLEFVNCQRNQKGAHYQRDNTTADDPELIRAVRDAARRAVHLLTSGIFGDSSREQKIEQEPAD